MNVKKTIAFLFFLVAGVVLGGLLASTTASIEWLKWLSYGKWVGIPTTAPFLLDLALLKFSFGIEVGVNIAQVITVVISLLTYRYVAQKL